MDWSPLHRLTRARPLPGSPWRLGWGTLSIAAVIVAVYILEMAVAAHHGVLWELIWHGEAATKWLKIFRIGPYWTEAPVLLFPHMFAHGAFLEHFLFNTVMLLLCAPSLEGRIGAKWTWGLFLAVGVFSGALQSSLLGSVSWGASGPGMTFFAAWVILDSRPAARRVWDWMDRFPRAQENSVVALYAEWGQHDAFWTWIPWGLVGLVALTAAAGIGSGDGIGHLTHLTGLVIGALLALVLQIQHVKDGDLIAPAGTTRP